MSVNGILSGMPTGVLTQDPMMDPKTAMMMQMGLGLMSAGGPSRLPVSLGQAFGQAGQQGLNAFQQLQQAQIAEEMRKRQMAMQEEQLNLQRQKANQPPGMLSGGPGTQFLDPTTGEVKHTVPFRPAEPQPARAPMSRQVLMDDQTVTQEFLDGQWNEVARAPRFAPKTETAQKPRAPTGFRYKEGSDELEPIPGGPKDTAPKDAARAQGAIQKADTVIRKVDEAMSQAGFSSTGLTGTVLGMVPGTKAYDLDKTIDTIKANLGFSELQAMREASPTGGALGQVAIQELAMLQSTVASLEKGQSEENLRRGLQQVRQHFQNWKNAVQQAQQGNPAPTASPAAPQATQPKRRTYNPKTGKFE